MQSSADKELCGLVVRQLQAYGLTSVAAVVADAVGIVPQLNPSDELAQLVAAGRRGSQHSQHSQQQQQQQQQPGGLDLDTEGGSGGAATRPFGKYECPFFTTHKKPTRAVAISPDGRLVATGSDDTTIKVLDATKVGTGSGARNYRDSSGDAEGADKPLLRTLYDHAGPINELAFHPTGLMLTSCAKDGAIKFFDMSREKKYSARQIQQAGTVRSISYHPSGDYLLAATDHHTAHLYEMANFNCYDPVDPDFEHRGPINSVRFSPQGHQYATASKDGSWKMWDAVAGKCIFTVSNAHVEAEIASVAFNPSTGKYVLTFGKDSTVRMWDSSNGNPPRKNYLFTEQYNFCKQVLSCRSLSARG